MSEKITQLTPKDIKRSEEASERVEEYEFFERSYLGGKEYVAAGYLRRHEREKKDAYLRRLEQSSFPNFCAPIVDLLHDYLFREEPERDLSGLEGNPLFEDFRADADLEGRSYHQMVMRLAKLASIYGFAGTIVDKPNIEAATKAQQIESGARPYIVTVKPEHIMDWRYERDALGRPQLVYLLLEEGEGRFIGWFPDHWERWEKHGNKQAQKLNEGENPLGVIPFVPFRGGESFHRMSGISDLSSIAYINRRIYELDSAAMEIIENTAFPFLEVPEDSVGADGQVVVGTGNAVTRPTGDTAGWKYIEPAHTSLPQLLAWRNQAVADIREQAKLDKATGTQIGSGIALEIEFQQLNAKLAARATMVEQAERGILNLFALWENLTWTGSVKYPDKFGTRDLATDLDNAIKAKALVSSRAFQQALAKDVAMGVLDDPDSELLAKIEQETAAAPSAAAFFGTNNAG